MYFNSEATYNERLTRAHPAWINASAKNQVHHGGGEGFQVHAPRGTIQSVVLRSMFGAVTLLGFIGVMVILLKAHA